MKIKVALLGLFFGQVMLAQNAADDLRTLEWASYHYMLVGVQMVELCFQAS